ncbi:unnamed protein product [Medioppia subpectinata]|uniref:Timeless N-terminal domain-containing protein n=1 Tax=Medioppia subpectinata TaxID=1979941 RepID=A0A7R9Q4B8_9ACAR|nr:unnamed protein product [Medioppia subpectinata]CAG2111454.1 unnamed protein product [Medioppia subpectinata]
MWSNNTELISEVIAVCNDLGHKSKQSDNKYIINKKDCNHVLKDLIRYLRNDTKHTFPVRSQLGSTNIVDNDLIPIVEQYCSEDIPLFDKTLRLLDDLTNPVIILFQEKIPTEISQYQKYLEFQSHLYSYKLSFGSHRRFWTVLAKHLTRIIEMDDENRQIEDFLMAERILILIRNVLYIPIDMSANQKVSEEYTNPHDRIIEVLHSSGIIDLILYLSNDDTQQQFQQFCFHLIEIISLIFKEQNAEFIAKSVGNHEENGGSNGDRRTDFEREIDRKEIKELKARDVSVLAKVRPNLNRFNGTYSIKNMKSISDRDIVCHKTPQDLSQISFDANKDIKRKLRSKKPMEDTVTNKTSFGPQVIHKSSFRVRKILYDFCVEFLNSYNQFMRRISDNLMRNQCQHNDETYYLWAIQFFMEFNRTNPKGSDRLLVSETMCLSSFHYLNTQIDHYMEIIKTDKQAFNLWSKRLHHGIKAYREALFSLNWFDLAKEEDTRYIAKSIKKKLFYEVEYRDQLLALLHEYNEAKMTKTLLKDLIETNHLFIKLLENYYKNNSRLLIREKVRRVKKKSTQKKTPIEKTPPEDIWNEIISTVSEALSGSLELPSPEEDISVRAFDATSEKTSDEQKMDVLRRVNNFLLDRKVVEAISLYRDARNCWTGDEDNAFGAADIAPEDELLSLNEILMTEFPNEATVEEPMDEEIEEQTEERESRQRVREREIEFNEVIHKYCHRNVVRNYCLLLRSYETNSDETNHCLLKMLHRIAFDCKMHAMLFQASLFRTFQRILSDPLRDSSSVKELKRFAKFIVSKFILVAKKNDKVFFELLFWKSATEATQVEDGYSVSVNTKGAKQLWSEEQELELKVLFEEYKDKGTADKDYVDLIVDHLIDDTKTRRQVIKELKRQEIFVETKKRRVLSEKKRSKNSNVTENRRFTSNEFVDDSDSSDGEDRREDHNSVNNDMEARSPKRNQLTDSEDEDNDGVIPEDIEAENRKDIEKQNVNSDDSNDGINESDKNGKRIEDNGLDDKSESSDSEDSDENNLQINEDIDETVESPKNNDMKESSDESSDETNVETNKRSFDDSDDEEVVVMSKNKKRHLIIDDSDED